MQDCCTGNLIVVLTSVLDPNADPEELNPDPSISYHYLKKKLPVL